MTGPTWEQPPPPGHGYDWPAIATELRANPNQWLRIFEDGPISVVNAIRQARITALTPVHRPGEAGGGFEVTTRNNKQEPPRQATMYLRWVPEGNN